MSWRFLDEASDAADRLLDRVAKDGAMVPMLWHLEVTNALLMGQKRGRLTSAQAGEFVALIEGLPIGVDETSVTRAMHDIRMLAQAQTLTAYDAAYLELAMRRGVPLASKDRALLRAAERLGVETVAV